MIEWLAPNFIYSLLKDALRFFLRKRRRLNAEQILVLRQKWRPLFDEEIWKTHSQKLRKDVIIRDVGRLDSYPEIDERRKGISPWFRIGLMATYHKGIMVGLNWCQLKKIQNGDWRYVDHKSGETGDVTAILIGYIPFECIEAVNWDGDEYYGYPHIYCHFDARKKEPYERLAFCVENCNPGGRPFYTEIAPYDKVRKTSRALKIEPSC